MVLRKISFLFIIIISLIIASGFNSEQKSKIGNNVIEVEYYPSNNQTERVKTIITDIRDGENIFTFYNSGNVSGTVQLIKNNVSLLINQIIGPEGYITEKLWISSNLNDLFELKISLADLRSGLLKIEYSITNVRDILSNIPTEDIYLKTEIQKIDAIKRLSMLIGGSVALGIIILFVVIIKRKIR